MDSLSRMVKLRKRGIRPFKHGLPPDAWRSRRRVVWLSVRLLTGSYVPILIGWVNQDCLDRFVKLSRGARDNLRAVLYNELFVRRLSLYLQGSNQRRKSFEITPKKVFEDFIYMKYKRRIGRKPAEKMESWKLAKKGPSQVVRKTKRDLSKYPDYGLRCRFCKIRRYDVMQPEMVCPRCRPQYHEWLGIG